MCMPTKALSESVGRWKGRGVELLCGGGGKKVRVGGWSARWVEVFRSFPKDLSRSA